MDYDEFIEYYEKGQKGETISIPIIDNPNSDKISKLGSKIDIGKSMYLIFGGSAGSGKTSCVDVYFVLNLYIWYKNNKGNTNIIPHWIYRSMERATFLKIAKWTCYLMYVDYGIIIDVATLLNKPNKLYDVSEKSIIIDGKPLSYDSIIRSYKPFFNEMRKYLNIKSGSDKPTNVFKFARNVILPHGYYIEANDDGLFINLKKIGDFTTAKEEVVNGITLRYKEIALEGKPIKVYEQTKKFIEKDPNRIFFHITDHIGKLDKEEGAMSDKQVIDKHSNYMGELRDIFYMTPIDIIQLNRNIEQTNYKGELKSTEINSSDFQGSSVPYQNCDIAIGMLNPYKLGVPDFDGYDIGACVSENGHNRFRNLKVIKNSWGIDDIKISYMFVGESGTMRELPRGEEMTSDIYSQIRNGKLNN